MICMIYECCRGGACNLHHLAHVFPGLDLDNADPGQPLTTAGEELGDLDDISVDDVSVDDLSEV